MKSMRPPDLRSGGLIALFAGDCYGVTFAKITVALPRVALLEASRTETEPRRNRPVPASLAAVPVAGRAHVAPDARAVDALVGTVTEPYVGLANESLYVYVVEPEGTA